MTLPSAFPLLAALLLATAPVLAAPTHSGTWTASVRQEKLQLSLRTKGEKSGQVGTSLPLAAFQGLSTADGGTAPFQLRREAGTFQFEGRFADGEGAGHFRFEPSEVYTRAMAGLGYTKLTPDEHYQLALFDITSSQVKELAALGYKNLSVEELVQAGIFQVTPDYVRALAAQGYAQLSLKQLVNTRVHGVTPERIRALADLGFKNLALDTLMAMSIHGVTPDFIREVREMGYPNATPEDLVKLKIHGIDSAFVRSLSGRKGGDDARKKP